MSKSGGVWRFQNVVEWERECVYVYVSVYLRACLKFNGVSTSKPFCAPTIGRVMHCKFKGQVSLFAVVGQFSFLSLRNTCSLRYVISSLVVVVVVAVDDDRDLSLMKRKTGMWGSLLHMLHIWTHPLRSRLLAFHLLLIRISFVCSRKELALVGIKS
jgi:hypothetical protein